MARAWGVLGPREEGMWEGISYRDAKQIKSFAIYILQFFCCLLFATLTTAATRYWFRIYSQDNITRIVLKYGNSLVIWYYVIKCNEDAFFLRIDLNQHQLA